MYMYININVSIYICKHIHTYIYIYIHIYRYIDIYVYMYLNIYIHTYILIWMYIHVPMYAYATPIFRILSIKREMSIHIIYTTDRLDTKMKKRAEREEGKRANKGRTSSEGDAEMAPRAKTQKREDESG